jgi:hypothetical protein
MAQNQTFSQWKQRLTAELKRDPKKTIILTVLLAAGAIVGIKAAVKQAPSSSAAAVLFRVAPAPSVASPGKSATDVASDLTRRQEYIKGLDKSLSRDIFQPIPEAFPINEKNGQAAKAPSGSATAPAETNDEIAGKVAQAAKGLNLASTLVGRVPIATINGNLLKVGDSVDGFCIKEITSHNCTVVKDEIAVVLEIQK